MRLRVSIPSTERHPALIAVGSEVSDGREHQGAGLSDPTMNAVLRAPGYECKFALERSTMLQWIKLLRALGA